MFEGQFNKKTVEEALGSDPLRQFRWTELVAKLSATRELRDELAKNETGGFEAFGEARRETCADGKRAVNHTALAHGKTRAIDGDRAANGAGHGDRET